MRIIFVAAAGALLIGCEGGGTSTQEIRAAAIERARQELQLSPDAPLEAKAWAGAERDGEPILCGTVSDPSAGSRVQPLRFAARSDPIEWLVFEPAHRPMVKVDPDKFVEWEEVCSTNEVR